jgi:hypothetical protein
VSNLAFISQEVSKSSNIKQIRLKKGLLYLKSTEVARNLSKPGAAVLNYYYSDSKVK